MSQNLWMSLANNAAMMLALFVIYEISYSISSKKKILQQILSGVLVAAICLAIMSMPFRLSPGVIFDTRTILISVTAMVFGLVPAAITVAAALIFRVISGGAGVYAGVATILSSAAIGLIWRRFLYPRKSRWRWLNVYAMSISVHSAMLACMLLLPYPQSVQTIDRIAIPVMLIYPVTSVVLSILLLHQQERKFFQGRLAQSEGKYRSITENITDVVWTIDLDLNTTYVSPSVKRLLGETPEEHARKKIEEKFPPDSLEKVKETFSEELAKEKDPSADKDRTCELELEHYRADGSVIWLSMNISFLRDKEGNAVGFQGISRNITKRKMAEEALKASEDKYYNYIENAPDGIVVSDKSGVLLEANKAAARMTGYTKDELFGMAVADLLNDTPKKIIADYFRILNEKGYIREEIQYRKKDGSVGWASVDSVAIDDSRYLNFVNDISARKRAKFELKQERDRAQMYLELSRVFFVALDTNMNITLINKEGCSIICLSKEKAVGMNWVDNFIPEKCRAEIKDYFRQITEVKVDDGTIHINPIIDINGNEKIISWRNAVLRDEKGEITGILSSGIDITEQESTLAALKESERSKSVLISHIPGLAYRCAYDKDWTMEFISEGCYELTGYKAQDLINNKKMSYNDLICEKYRQQIWDDWGKVIAAKESYKGEYEIKTASGAAKWVLEMGQPVFDANGEVEALEGLVIDIDEPKKQYDQIIYMNDHDFLTDLYNRRYFEREISEIDRKENLPLAVMIADINGVRLVNDAFGHLAGDRMIKSTGEIIKKSCPERAVVARIGGDEFGILLPNAGKEEINSIIQCIFKSCEEYESKTTEEPALINISMGLSVKEGKEETIGETLKEAEDNMYRHKLLDRESHHNAIISSVMATMYARSQETEEHAERLAEISVRIGKAMGLSAKNLDDLKLLAMLHDIGKIGIDDRILNKEGPLSKKEWEIMKKHPEIGFRIAMSSSDLEPVAQYILHHHERWDGDGYPTGLSGEDIPLLSRILAVVDAYDAMTKDRVYRKATGEANAIKEIKENAGTQFDPHIAGLFLKLIEAGEFNDV